MCKKRGWKDEKKHTFLKDCFYLFSVRPYGLFCNILLAEICHRNNELQAGRIHPKPLNGEKTLQWGMPPANAAMNLNCPDCQTTNQMTFLGAQPITGVKFSSFQSIKSFNTLQKKNIYKIQV